MSAPGSAVVDLDHVQIAMPAGREADARAFYGDLLGLPELPKPEPLAGRGGAWFRLGARQLHLGVEKDFAPARKAHPAFIVGDLDALRSALEAAGHVTKDDAPIDGRRRFFSADPFGNRLEFLAYDQAGAAA